MLAGEPGEESLTAGAIAALRAPGRPVTPLPRMVFAAAGYPTQPVGHLPAGTHSRVSSPRSPRLVARTRALTFAGITATKGVLSPGVTFGAEGPAWPSRSHCLCTGKVPRRQAGGRYRGDPGGGRAREFSAAIPAHRRTGVMIVREATPLGPG